MKKFVIITFSIIALFFGWLHLSHADSILESHSMTVSSDPSGGNGTPFCAGSYCFYDFVGTWTQSITATSTGLDFDSSWISSGSGSANGTIFYGANVQGVHDDTAGVWVCRVNSGINCVTGGTFGVGTMIPFTLIAGHTYTIHADNENNVSYNPYGNTFSFRIWSADAFNACDNVKSISLRIPTSTISNDFPTWQVSTDNLEEGCNYNIGVVYTMDASSSQLTYSDSFAIGIYPDSSSSNLFSFTKKRSLWLNYKGTSTIFTYILAIQNSDDGTYVGTTAGSFTLTANNSSTVPQGYNISQPCGGLGYCNLGNQSFFNPTSTANEVCGSTSTYNFWDISTWTCGIINIGNTIASDTAERFYFITANTVTQVQGAFLFNPIFSLNSDIDIAASALASTSETISMQSSSTWNGYRMTFFTSSTTGWIQSRAGFDYRGFMSKLMYLITGILMLMITIKIIASLVQQNNGNVTQ